MPDVLTTRLLGAFGLPVIFARSHGDTPFVFASVATEVLIWAILFYLLALGVVSLRRRSKTVRLPNTRVQRTRSSASPPHSPLTRSPLGGPEG